MVMLYRSNFLNALGFIFFCAVYWFNFATEPMDFSLDLITLALLVPGCIVYMFIHDAWFFAMHRTSHRFKPLWYYLHEHHHTAVKMLNVFHVGYAEVVENLLQV